jgi:hypothetical protein
VVAAQALDQHLLGLSWDGLAFRVSAVSPVCDRTLVCSADACRPRAADRIYPDIDEARAAAERLAEERR